MGPPARRAPLSPRRLRGEPCRAGGRTQGRSRNVHRAAPQGRSGTGGVRRRDGAAGRRTSRGTTTPATCAPGGCPACCTARIRCRRKSRSSGTTTSPPATPRCRMLRFMLGQYELMRRHALGNFRSAAAGDVQRPGHDDLARQPRQQEGQPQRELCPRTDGAVQPRHRPLHREGHPRSGPGLHRLGDQGTARPSSTPTQHDDGEKTVLGQTGNLQAATTSSASAWSRSRRAVFHRRQAVSLPRQRNRAADAGTARAAGAAVPQERLRLRRAGRDDAALEPVLLAAWSIARRSSRRSISRSASSAAWKASIGTTALAAGAASSLGQNVFSPPSVKGWDGGRTWLNGQTLLFRQNLALALTSTQDDRFGRRTDPAAWPASTARRPTPKWSTSSCACSCKATCRPSRARACSSIMQQAQQAADAGILDGGGRSRSSRSGRVSSGVDVAGVSTGLNVVSRGLRALATSVERLAA